MHKSLIVAAALFGIAGPAMAAAPGACVLRIESGVTNWVIPGFDVFDTTPPQAGFDVTFINDGSGPCRFTADFALDGEAYGLAHVTGDTASYTLLDAFSSANVTPVSGHTVSTPMRRRVELRAGQQQLVHFQFNVARNDLEHDGRFVQHVRLEATDDDGNILAGRPLVLGIFVQPSARMGLSGAFRLRGGQPVIDLGELNEGVAPVPLRLRIDSTRRYDVSFHSTEGGQLRLQGTNWTIPYGIVLGEHSISLTGGEGSYSSDGSDELRRDTLALSFVIGSTRGRRAGVYADVLSITVAPQ